MHDKQDTMNPHAAPVISIRDVHVCTPSETILSQVSLQIEQQGFFVILGPSGIGKSTLLNVLAGIVPIAGGTIAMRDTSVSYMTQQISLLPWMRIIDNVMLGYKLRKTNTLQVKNKALALLEAVGLPSHANAYPTHLSGGECQRVMLARTLLEDTGIVLMDEPFAALDAINRHHLGLLALKLFSKRTTLMVTHDIHEALRLADQIFLMTSARHSLIKIEMPSTKPPREVYNKELMTQYQSILRQIPPQETV